MQSIVSDQIQIGLLIAAVCMLFVTVVIAIAGAVWVVAKGKERNAVLGEVMKGLGRSLDQLRDAIGNLNAKLGFLDEKVDSHTERLARIEGRM